MKLAAVYDIVGVRMGVLRLLLLLLTHALELVLELRLVVAVGDAEVEIGVILLEEDVGRDGRTNGKHGGGAIRALHDPSGRSLSFDGGGVEVTIGSHCEQ